MRATLPQPPPPSPARPVEPLPGAAGAQQEGRRQGGRGQARQLEKARAAGIRPMARPGAAARQQKQECPARAQVASCPPPARPEPPARGRTRGEGGRIECLRCLPALGVPGAHPLFCTAVSGALSWQQLPTRSLPSWGTASGAPKGSEARVSGGTREAREDWATGSESPCQQSLMPDLNGIPHSRLSRSPTSLKPGLNLT